MWFVQENFLPLYDLQYSFMWVTFCGKTEDELSGQLENIRESAKRMGLHWAHRRACFLLGRLCAKKLKFSQVWTFYCTGIWSEIVSAHLIIHGYDDFLLHGFKFCWFSFSFPCWIPYIYFFFLLSSGSRLLRGSSQCLRGQFLRHAAPHRALHKSHRHLPKATYDGQAAPDSWES